MLYNLFCHHITFIHCLNTVFCNLFTDSDKLRVLCTPVSLFFMLNYVFRVPYILLLIKKVTKSDIGGSWCNQKCDVLTQIFLYPFP